MLCGDWSDARGVAAMKPTTPASNAGALYIARAYLVLLASVPGPALAQISGQANGAQPAQLPTSTAPSTGTLLAGDPGNATRPVTEINRSTIDLTGAINTEDLLLTLPQFFQGP